MAKRVSVAGFRGKTDVQPEWKGGGQQSECRWYGVETRETEVNANWKRDGTLEGTFPDPDCTVLPSLPSRTF